MQETRDIRLGFRMRNDSLLITISSDLEQNEVRFRKRVKPEDPKAINDELNYTLTDAVRRIVNQLGDQITVKEETSILVRNEFRRVAEQGYIAVERIFGEEFLETLKKLIGSATKIVLHIDSESFVVPWEILYDNYQRDNFDYNNFWGYKYIIYRSIPPRSGKQVPNQEISLNGALDVGLLADMGLTNVSQVEVPFLQKLHSNKSINLITPLKQLIAKERDTILDKELPKFFGQEMHIVHFACHTRGPKASLRDPNDEYCLLLAKDFPLWPRDFNISKLRFGDDPLIILNACGTSPRNPFRTWSMVQTMLGYGGARGAITTECIVPDALAAIFIQSFYRLILRGVDIGEALFETRREFLDAPYHNPLGLLYALYAFPHTRFICT